MGEIGYRRRRRWPFVLLILLVLLTAAATAVDFIVRDATENAVASDVRTSTHAARATVAISSFPFLYNVAVNGLVDHIVVDDYEVPAGTLRIDQVHLDVHDVRLDRHQLLQDRHVHITSVSRATITVVAKLSSLQSSLANDVGLEVTGRSSDALSVQALGRTVATVDLTRIPIVPLCPVTIEHTGGTYRFTCTVAPVPQSVLDALSQAASARGL
ncbi:MAG: LmeA family phospholipid-binding protein [Actinomycetota bacterium]|nr:LmeA family phospholipid-binding protein [Actinomycetota bacterium]